MLFLVLWLQDGPAPKIADLSSATGDVAIVDAKGGSRTPKRFGTRLKNAEIRDEDRIKTGAGAQAVVIFPDASKFTLKENSEIQVLQKTLPKPTPEGNTVGRRIKILVGDLVSEVMQSKDIRTDFETPAGSAAVRGTALRLVVDGARKSLQVSVEEGTVRFLSGEYSTRLDMPAGARVVFTRGSLDIVVETGSVAGAIGDQGVQMNAGDHVVVDTAATGITCDIRDGIIDVKDAAGQYQPTQTDFPAATDPATTTEAATFDPNAATFAPFMPPPPDDLLREPIFDRPPTDVPIEDTASTSGTTGILSPLAENALHIGLLAFDISFHTHFDNPFNYMPRDNIVFAAHDLGHTQGLEAAFQRVAMDVRDGFYGGLSQINPLLQPGREQDFHGSQFGFGALKDDLRVHAGQIQSGILDPHLLGHILIDFHHATFHQDIVVLPPINYNSAHNGFHNTNGPIDRLHNSLHGLPFHNFLHDYIGEMHGAWHGSTGLPFVIPPGDPAFGAHLHFHERIDEMHDTVHKLTGLPLQ